MERRALHFPLLQSRPMGNCRQNARRGVTARRSWTRRSPHSRRSNCPFRPAVCGLNPPGICMQIGGCGCTG